MSKNQCGANKGDFLFIDAHMEWMLIFDAIPDPTAIIDTDFCIRKVNKAMSEFLDMKPQDIIGKKCFCLIHEENEPLAICPHSSMLRDLKPHVEHIHEDRLDKDLIVSVSPIFDDGELRGSVHIIHDDTNRTKLEESNERLASIVRNSNDAIIGKDLQGIINSWNSGAEKIYGYSAEEAIGKNISILIPPDHTDDFPFMMEKIKSNEEINNYDTIRINKNGEKIHVSLTISPVTNYSGEIIGASTIARDITEIIKAKSALKENEKKFREVFNNANDAFFLHKIKDGSPGTFQDVNKVACDMLGYSKEELLQMTPGDIDDPRTAAQIPQRMNDLQENGKLTFESFQIAKNGAIIPVEINAVIFNLNRQKLVLSIARDITNRIKADKALKESERKYRTIFENVQDVFYQTNLDGIIMEISPSIFRYSGFTREELIGKPVEMVYSNPEDRKKLLETVSEKGEIVDYEVKLKTKDNSLLYASTNAHVWFDEDNNPIGIEGSLRDVTERKNMEMELRELLKEKEMLLKEIHHRVKNNLMIISSLLDLQSKYIRDKVDLKLFRESQARADSMALIHERLYQSSDLKHINFGDYIQNLSKGLFNTYALDASRIKLDLEVMDIMLDINAAIPLGLIVNELITNSLKHGFPDEKKGKIEIKFYNKGEYLFLEVQDNGAGIPDQLDFRNTNTLGLLLINSLTKQIDGKISLDKKNGTKFTIKFKEPQFNK